MFGFVERAAEQTLALVYVKSVAQKNEKDIETLNKGKTHTHTHTGTQTHYTYTRKY